MTSDAKSNAREGLIPPSPTPQEHHASTPAAEEDITGDDPIALFKDWFQRAKDKEPRDPHAMTLATVDPAGMPDARMVLLKGVDEGDAPDGAGGGFVFYTNTDSRKGVQLSANPAAALCFYWKSLARQVRIQGPVRPVADAEADAYFASRARDSRIGAWASLQSQPMESRFALETRLAAVAARYAIGDVPRPPNWSGYRLTPVRMEFWRERPFRLHDRVAFTRAGPEAPWTRSRLYP